MWNLYSNMNVKTFDTAIRQWLLYWNSLFMSLVLLPDMYFLVRCYSQSVLTQRYKVLGKSCNLDVAFFHSFFNIWKKKSNFFIIICASKLFLCFLINYDSRQKYIKYSLIYGCPYNMKIRKHACSSYLLCVLTYSQGNLEQRNITLVKYLNSVSAPVKM